MASRLTEHFIPVWNSSAQHTVRLLKALPVTQYDFRPDPGGRSLGELAWHLAEIDAYMSHGLETRSFEMGVRPPGIERPRTIEALAPAYERVHADAVVRVRNLSEDALAGEIRFFDGRPMKAEDILWLALLHHSIHHRGQLMLLCRLAGGTPPGIYGPSREEMAAMKPRG
jgi:uncharacterized damage-inducible protein DinB